MANKNITQLTPQTGSADTTSLFYTVTGGNSDKSLPFSVFVNNLGLTGVPTVPTATLGTNTTQIASTAFVQTALGPYAPKNNPVFTGTIGGGAASISLGGVASFASIQSTPVGTTASAAGTFTTLTANTALIVNGTLSGPGVSTYLTTYLASPPAIGGTSASAGTFTTLAATTITASSTITPSQTAGIVGTTTNNNANAGSVGEHQTATGSSTGLTSGSYVDLATLSLTAGDWDIQGFVNFNGSSLAATTWVVGINTVANTQPGNPNLQFQTFSSGILTGGSLISPTVRQSLASTTTIRCGGRMDFASGSVTATGTIRARRVR